MKKIAWLLLPIITLAFSKEQLFKKTQITGNVELDMPGEPVKTELSPKAWRYQTVLNDSTTFGAVVNDNTVGNQTEQKLVDIKETLQKVLEQQKARVEQRGETVLSESAGEFKDKPFVEIKFSKAINGSEKITYGRTLFHKQYNIYLFYKSGLTGVNEKVKDEFFNSLAFK